MTPRSTFTRHLVTSAVLLLAGAPVFAQTALPLAELGAGMYRIEAEVAHTFETRQVGLMNRAAMPLHRGMVFVFPEARAHCMWMKNTPLPLSVAFVDEQGRILNIEDMQPQTEDNHCAARPAAFALEMNQGWFAKKGIAPGARIGGVESLAGRGL